MTALTPVLIQEKIKVSIIDDCDIFRLGLRVALSDDNEFEITSCSGFDFKLSETSAQVPDVVLIHTTVREIDDQIKVIQRVKKLAKPAKVLMISEFLDIDYLTKVLMSGCDGYVLRNVSEESLKRAIKSLHREIFVFDRNVIGKILQISDRGWRGRPTGINSRETRIVELISRGLTNSEIASELDLATGTVRNIISGMILRYDCRKRTQLVSLLMTRGSPYDDLPVNGEKS